MNFHCHAVQAVNVVMLGKVPANEPSIRVNRHVLWVAVISGGAERPSQLPEASRGSWDVKFVEVVLNNFDDRYPR